MPADQQLMFNNEEDMRTRFENEVSDTAVNDQEGDMVLSTPDQEMRTPVAPRLLTLCHLPYVLSHGHSVLAEQLS